MLIAPGRSPGVNPPDIFDHRRGGSVRGTMTELMFTPSGIQGHASNVCELADQLRSLRRTWLATAEAPGDACGLQDVKDGYDKTQQAWADELNVYIELLDEVCRKLGTSAKIYGDTEDANLAETGG